MVAESSQASRQPAVPRSQYVGVSMKTYCNRQVWQTTINVHGKAYHLGYFESETEAARHYDKYARANNKPVNFPVPHANPPEVPLYERIVRNILADKPRVTRYQIDWSN